MIGGVSTISDFGNAKPRRIPITGVQWSRELSNVGTFSGFVKLTDLRRVGLADDLIGSWVTYDDPDAGRWGGVITDQPIDDGVVEIMADGWAALLGGQVVDTWDRQAIGQPAGLVRRALSLVGADAPVFVEIGNVDEGGSQLQVSFGGQLLLDDIMPELAEAGELEWWVDDDRKLHMGRHIGRDKSASIRLVEGRHFVEPKLADGLSTRQPARIYAIESDESTARRMVRRVRIATETAVPQVVNRQVTEVIRRRHRHNLRWTVTSWVSDVIWTRVITLGDEAAVGSAAEQSSNIATWPEQPPGTSTHSLAVPPGKGLEPQTIPCQLTVINQDNLWRKVDLGDVVRIEVGSAGFSGWFRLLIKALDATERTMSWAGEALPDARVL